MSGAAITEPCGGRFGEELAAMMAVGGARIYWHYNQHRLADVD